MVEPIGWERSGEGQNMGGVGFSGKLEQRGKYVECHWYECARAYQKDV